MEQTQRDWLTGITKEDLKEYFNTYREPCSDIIVEPSTHGTLNNCRDIVLFNETGKTIMVSCIGSFGFYSKHHHLLSATASPFNPVAYEEYNQDFSFYNFMIDKINEDEREIYTSEYILAHMESINRFYGNKENGQAVIEGAQVICESFIESLRPQTQENPLTNPPELNG